MAIVWALENTEFLGKFSQQNGGHVIVCIFFFFVYSEKVAIFCLALSYFVSLSFDSKLNIREVMLFVCKMPSLLNVSSSCLVLAISTDFMFTNMFMFNIEIVKNHIFKLMNRLINVTNKDEEESN